MMRDLIGQTINGYQILEQIGEGGMATVYKAYQPSLDRYVAVKVLPRHLSREKGFSQRFTREAKAVAKLEHPQILPVYDFGQADDLSFITMRYVDAGTLKDLMEQPLDLWRISDLIGQIAEALDYAHEQGFVHRDVKPSNVLMDRGEWVLLSDFGLAKMMEGSEQITATGVGVGTPSYMSPEQGRGDKVDHRSDIYSLGVILYEMATGQLPYQAETPVAIVYKHIHESLPLPREINPDIPEVVERVILKTLAKRAGDRYQTAGNFAQALREAIRSAEAEIEKSVIAEQDQTIIEKERVEQTWKQRVRQLWWAAPLALGVFFFGLMIGLRPFQVQPGGGEVESVETVSEPPTAPSQIATDTLSPTPIEEEPIPAEEKSQVIPDEFEAIDLLLWSNEDASIGLILKAKFNEWASLKALGSTLKIILLQTEELREDFQNLSSSGDRPDLVWTVSDQAGVFEPAGLIQPVDDLLDLSAFVDSVVSGIEHKGKHWGIPISFGNHLMLLYNKDFIDSPPRTTNELIEVAQSFRGTGVQGFAYNLNEPFWLIPWLGGHGGQVFLADGVTPNLNSPEMIATFQLLRDFKFKHGIVPSRCDYDCMNDLFIEGSAAMVINGDWSLALYEEYLGDQLGVANIPEISGAGMPAPYTSGKFLMLPNWLTGARREAVISFASWLTQEKENQLDLSVPFGRIPALKQAIMDPRATENDIARGSLSQAVRGTSMPIVPEMRCVWDALLPTLKGVMEASLTPSEAAAEAQRLAESCIVTLER